MSAPAPRRAGATASDLAVQSLRDLRDDFDELLFVARNGSAQLARIDAEYDDLAPRLHAETAALLRSQVRLLGSRYGELARRLLGLRQRAAGAHETEVAALAEEREACAELLRTQQTVIASLATACDWQSPPFATSSEVGSGGEYGLIRAHWNDYKRDRHLDADEYEQAYVAELVDAPGDWRALVTACGMAAFTTIVGFVAACGLGGARVVAGSALYHESRLVLQQAFGERVQWVDEDDLPRVVRSVRPRVVFVDSLCNTRWAPLPDIAAVVHELEHAPHESVVVVDNTGLAAAYQPLRVVRPDGRVRMIVFESLLKYHQLGLDRVNAGVVVASARDGEVLSACREHLGTNAADTAVRALPPPRRHVLERRLARVGRNAQLIAERLEREAGGAVEAVVYPGLPSHRSFSIAGRLAFPGGCVSLVLREPGREEELVAAAIAEARTRGARLVGGSSFGFDTTRIYLTAARAPGAESFVRIAAGTEHRADVEVVADALAAAVR